MSDDWGHAYNALSREWRDVVTSHDPVTGWAAALELMEAEEDALRESGQWRSGGRTLLRALWLHHDEVILCRGLAWLLTPDGWHGLGASLLNSLLNLIDQQAGSTERAVVVTEEVREGTRADIVVRFTGVCILIEAKVWALEQEAQADRLADLWADEMPVLVFLTRDGRRPVTALRSAQDWLAISWRDMARLLDRAIRERPDCEPGVREFLHTLEEYGGKP